MESPPPLARYVPHSSKKRVFPGGSSMEEEVVEIPPPINRTSNSLKRKEIYDIIDVDIEEECNDARLGEGSFIPNGKGKEIFVDLSLGTSGGSENTTTVKGFLSKNKNCTSEPQNVINLEDSDDLYGDNEHMDMFYDESTHDQYTNLQLYFDRMDVPPGIEASVPWWPGPSGDKLSSIRSSTPSYLFPAQMKTASVSSGKMSSHSSESVKFHKLKEKVTSRSGPTFGDRSGRTRKLGLSVPFVEPALGVKRSVATGSSIGTDSTYKDSVEFPPQGQGQKLFGLRGFSQSKKRSQRATTSFGSHNLSTPLEPYFPKVTAKSWMADWMNVLPNSTNHSTADSPSLFSHVLPDGLLPPVGFVSLYPDPVTSHKNTNATENAPASMQSTNIDEILERFRAFKKFDTVQDYSDHHYSRNASRKVNAASKAWIKRIQEEWKILEKDLPDTIFVRVYESRMDLLRAVIVGAAGTPYHDGLFFFDVFFPSSYPNVPPQVYYHSGGLRINPNLYNCGKVCLSLLNTWSGHGKEKWMPRESTMLQVLVSIQGLILNAKPYFNEPGFAGSEGTVAGEQSSLQYNENTYISNLRTMLYSIRKPPKHFEDFVAGHFVLHAQDILVACKTYIDGALVHLLVIVLSLTAFGFAIAAERRRSTGTLHDDTTSNRTYCVYSSDVATGYGVGAFLFLLSSESLVMGVTKCMCFGRPLSPGGNRAWTIIYFISSWLSFVVAEACLVAGAKKNAYHTKYRDMILAENFSCETLRKGVFVTGAVFVVATMILNVYYYMYFTKATTQPAHKANRSSSNVGMAGFA